MLNIKLSNSVSKKPFKISIAGRLTLAERLLETGIELMNHNNQLNLSRKKGKKTIINAKVKIKITYHIIVREASELK